MDSLDEFDARELFDTMDDDKTGEISLESFYTIYLGMGYPRLSIAELRGHNYGQGQSISIEIVVSVLSKFSRNRREEMSTCFSLVDRDKKEYISPSDVQELAQQAEDFISDAEAKAMVEQTTSTGKLYESDFQKLMAPPSL